jgi:hypothetical protein
MTAFEVTGFDRLLAIRRVDDMSRASHRRFDLRADVTESAWVPRLTTKQERRGHDAGKG